MHHDLPLLINIAAALVAAFIGGLLARWLGLPTIVGYLAAGVAIGPFTPGFVGDVETISQLAELGVIFLMFGVGLHFSLKDLWMVRDAAIPGALIVLGKFGITVALGFFFPRPARTALVVAAGLSQIGEFSFIVGQAGVSLGIMSQDQYSLILAGALLSIMVNPLKNPLRPPTSLWLECDPSLFRIFAL
jgi:predicted Kef-type K+ transport protein